MHTPFHWTRAVFLGFESDSFYWICIERVIYVYIINAYINVTETTIQEYT